MVLKREISGEKADCLRFQSWALQRDVLDALNSLCPNVGHSCTELLAVEEVIHQKEDSLPLLRSCLQRLDIAYTEHVSHIAPLPFALREEEGERALGVVDPAGGRLLHNILWSCLFFCF